MGISRYKVHGTQKLQATGDPSFPLALIASQPRSVEVACRSAALGSMPFSRAISADAESGKETIGRMDFHNMNHVLLSDRSWINNGATRMANEGDLSGALAAPFAFSLSSGSERTPRSGLPCSTLVS